MTYRLFVALLHGGPKLWVPDCVVDAQPNHGSDELWLITTQQQDGQTKKFHVLGPTGEVVAHHTPNPTTDVPSQRPESMRSDWSRFLKGLSDMKNSFQNARTLFELVECADTEGYEGGISRAWLRRVQYEPFGTTLVRFAQRYILANVVPNRFVIALATRCRSSQLLQCKWVLHVRPRNVKRHRGLGRAGHFVL